MKTIKDIITGKKNMVTTRETINTLFVGGELNVNIEKYKYLVCSYSKNLPYRHQQNGYKPLYEVRYIYTYDEGRKRLKSKEYKSLNSLMLDLKLKTSKVEIGETTMEVLETEYSTD